ncbi:hypothetical protein BDV23DRAFT_163833 [Aspergillus alliaceus]|uniref:Uncharacterized protein n=1 Tax=Petromyces alliaceus TaxID=209559 RepID=A0A5N7BWD2_PETAA|nr:hypothetical protein BDV23DRAFT_163833 [Aspergillus alliaceus]
MMGGISALRSLVGISRTRAGELCVYIHRLLREALGYALHSCSCECVPCQLLVLRQHLSVNIWLLLEIRKNKFWDSMSPSYHGVTMQSCPIHNHCQGYYLLTLPATLVPL